MRGRRGLRAVPVDHPRHPGRRRGVGVRHVVPPPSDRNACGDQPLEALPWAWLSALCGEADPLSAAWIAFHIGSEIFGYLVPRLSLVRPLAVCTASTHGLRAGFCVTCWVCTLSSAET